MEKEITLRRMRKRDYTEEDEKKYQIEPDINEFLDFSFCGE